MKANSRLTVTRLIKAAVLVAVAIAGTVCATVHQASARPVPHAAARSLPRGLCPAGYSCPFEPADFIDRSQTKDPQFIVSDPSNAPQFSVGTGGAASWANPLCITNNPLTSPPLRFVACIGGGWGNGQGRPLVTLYDARGRPYTLTVRDIAYLHSLERSRQ